MSLKMACKGEADFVLFEQGSRIRDSRYLDPDPQISRLSP